VRNGEVPGEDPHDDGVMAPVSPTDPTIYPQMVRERHRATVLRYRKLLRAP